jgi:long-chain acyl-CoA synthetase
MEAPPRTLADVFETGIARHPRPDRYLARRNGGWTPLSTEDVARRVRACAGALARLGLRRGDRVALLSRNRFEWVQVDWACQLLGLADVPVYPTLPAEQARFILQDAGVRAAFVENGEQAVKIAGTVPGVVSFEPAEGCIPFAEFLRDAPEPPGERPGEADLATLIYTSGTTGVPKGVRLTHRNLVSNLLACGGIVPCSAEDVVLSVLPLSHSFERLMDYALFWKGACIAHVESPETVAEDLLRVRPTLMAAVPRFFEKFRAAVRKAVESRPRSAQGLFEWARRVEGACAVLEQRGLRPPLRVRLVRALARRLVLRAVHARLGGRIRFFISGGGALAREVAEFLFSVGLPVYEGYGLTESSPVLTLNLPGATRLGSVGLPIPGVELRFAEDGEILARGPNVMEGYHGRPEESAETLRDGWLRTGDVGTVDAEGFVRITDRKKDLFKTSGGKYVAPQPIENRLKLDPRILDAVVLGDGRRFASALLVAAPGTDREALQAVVDEVNRGFAPHEQVRKFAVVERAFSIEGGELTPTLKVRRRVVERLHAALIDALYVE